MARKKSSFINYVNQKYCKELGKKERSHLFDYWDDYAMWLFYEKAKEDETKYYAVLEKDIWEYSDKQTGTIKEAKNNK